MRISVIGPGRAGTAISQHARAAGLACSLGRRPDADADIVLIAVPDDAVADVAASIPTGPAVGTLSGSAPLDALEPHARRFVLHPMQTIQPDRDDLQLTGCAAGVTADDPATLALAEDLARALGMQPLRVPEAARPLPHIACVLASNLLLPPLVAAMRVLAASGVDSDAATALGPLILRSVENALAAGPAAQPTGPVARGDAGTIRAHRRRLRALDPELDRTYALLSTALLPLAPPTARAAVAPCLGPEP